jgi:ribosomal-protein-alanine N-acetyltransferase
MTENQQKIFPIIEFGDYILREQEDSDVEDFFRYYTDPSVNEFILTEVPRSTEDARRELYYWRNVFYNNDGIYFAIANKSDNKMIGAVGLSSKYSHHNRIELSYDMAKEYWRKGIMTSAIGEVIKYGFEELKINRIEAFASINNIPSIKLLEKCGFKLEGRLRQHRFHRGQYVDVYVFSRLRNDVARS